MKQLIQEIYNQGLEKYAGDQELAKEFVKGFLKEASASAPTQLVAQLGRSGGQASKSFMSSLLSAAGSGVGAAGGALLAGLALHGIASTLANAGSGNLRQRFEASLNKVMTTTPMSTQDKKRAAAFAETIFKFAPNVSTDPNMLSTLLLHMIQSGQMDVTIIKNITDLEGRYLDQKKNNLFTPKMYV